MIILGIDPGTVKTGWGVIQRKGSRLVGVSAGVISVKAKAPLAARLRDIHAGLTAVIEEHVPDQIAVEDIFFAKYANAALKLGHARGVALLAAAQAERAVHAYPPTVVKRTVAGRGRADKAQVAQLVCAMLGWRVVPEVDATDALAIAITHAQASRMTAMAKGRVR